MRRLLATVRFSAVALALAGFLAGLSGGLAASHAWLEADVPLRDLAAPEDVRAEHGDRVEAHGRVVERRVAAETLPDATSFTYVVVLDDGTARVPFEVARADHDRLKEGRWTVVALRWEEDGWAVAAVEGAVQPWTWTVAGAAAAAAALGALVLWGMERGLVLKRKGHAVEVHVQK